MSISLPKYTVQVDANDDRKPSAGAGHRFRLIMEFRKLAK